MFVTYISILTFIWILVKIEENGKKIWGTELEQDSKVEHCGECGVCKIGCAQHCQVCGRQAGKRGVKTVIKVVNNIMTEEVTEILVENGEKTTVISWYQQGKLGKR